MEVAIKKLADDDVEFVVGGNTAYYPNNQDLVDLGLYDIVHLDTDRCLFNKDAYFNTKRSDGWKKVGSDDMLAYVKRTIGKNDPRYKALDYACKYGAIIYEGKFIKFTENSAI